MNLTVIRIALVILSYVLAYYLSWYFGSLYFSVFPSLLGGGFFPDDAAKSFMGISLALVALISLSITTVGGAHKYWWIGVALVPAILFEVVIDPLHLYFPIALGLIVWGLGKMANKTLRKVAPSFMSKIG